MKRIIRTASTELHLFTGVIYDGMEDVIVDENEDHTGALYASIDTPVFSEDGEGNRIKLSNETVLIAPHASIKKIHTYAGWEEVGQDI